jgi:hypothetical protein
MEYGFVLVGIFALGLIKLSVTLLYWHIFSRVKIRRFLIFWIIIISTWTLSFILAELLECGAHPLKVFGTAKDVKKYCPHLHTIGYGYVGSDVGTDLITLLIPLPLVTMIDRTNRFVLMILGMGNAPPNDAQNTCRYDISRWCFVCALLYTYYLQPY